MLSNYKFLLFLCFEYFYSEFFKGEKTLKLLYLFRHGHENKVEIINNEKKNFSFLQKNDFEEDHNISIDIKASTQAFKCSSVDVEVQFISIIMSLYKVIPEDGVNLKIGIL